MNAPIEEPLRIIDEPYKDEHNVIQIPTNYGRLTVTQCAATAKINPKALYNRLARAKDSWMREDILAKYQSNSGGGYRYETNLDFMCKGLGPRRDIATIKLGSYERRYI